MRKTTRDRAVLTVLASWTQLSDASGLPVSIPMIDTDITAAKQAEIRLRESEERFRSLAETISEIFWIRDAGTGRFEYVSPAFEAITGLRSQALYDSPTIWANAIHPDDRDRVAQAVQRTLRQGTLDEIYRLVRPDGTVRWLHERAFPVRGPDGRLVRMVGTAADVTQSRRVEEQLQQSQKMEAIGRLADGVAHDFNNLLTVIIGHCDILFARPDLPEPVLSALRPIAAAADRASALTSQLLGFSRKTILRPQVVNLNDIVRELGDMLPRLIGGRIRFLALLSPELDRPRVDPGQVGQIILNLAVNARDAMPEGGRLTVETANVEITSEAAPPDRMPGPYVMLAMTDTGTGMTPEVRAQIFDPFFTTKRVGEGTGLGLSMVFGIVQQSGGFIGVYSEPGAGTTFRIFFPAIRDGAPLPVPSPATRRAAGGETVLLVEDERDVRDLARLALEDQGYRVLTATDGPKALWLLAQNAGAIHALVTDVVMPGMSGPGLAQLMKLHHPGLRVLFMSGYTDDAMLRHGLLEADVAFIQKPFPPAELARQLRALLDGHVTGWSA
jgi:two-component system cell cycle sensor histidine kinase/response regulator CckA